MFRGTDFKGIFSALITSFTEKGDVDTEAIREIIEFNLKHGVHGFQPCGSTGLGILMTRDQRRKVAEVVVDQVHGRVPVLFHIGAADTASTMELAHDACEAGVDALACVTPFYYSYDDDALLKHYSEVAQSVERPIFLYNIPRYTGNNITPKLLLKLSTVPGIVGVKDSTRDFDQLLDEIEILPKDFVVFSGADKFIFPGLITGTKGCVSRLANAFPDLCVAIYKAFVSGDRKKGMELQFNLNSIKQLLDKPGITPIYEALKIRGVKSGLPKAPIRLMTDDEKEILHGKLKSSQFTNLLVGA